jgi:hypothetical protein
LADNWTWRFDGNLRGKWCWLSDGGRNVKLDRGRALLKTPDDKVRKFEETPTDFMVNIW